MDGALPSVVAGLVSAPVVAVPTSVGYGAAFEGLAALLAMLNACAPGVAVVNIDNGYGAGHLAAQIAARLTRLPLKDKTHAWTLSGFADEIDPDLDEPMSRSRRPRHQLHRVPQRMGRQRPGSGRRADRPRPRTILASHDIQVSSIGSPIGKINIEDDFDAHLPRMDRALTVAQRLSAPYIRLFSFFLRADQAPADHRDEVIRRMRALVDGAAGHDVMLLHENEKDIYGDVHGLDDVQHPFGDVAEDLLLVLVQQHHAGLLRHFGQDPHPADHLVPVVRGRLVGPQEEREDPDVGGVEACSPRPARVPSAPRARRSRPRC